MSAGAGWEGSTQAESNEAQSSAIDDDHQIELSPLADGIDERSSAQGSDTDSEQDRDVAAMLELLRRRRDTLPQLGINR